MARVQTRNPTHDVVVTRVGHGETQLSCELSGLEANAGAVHDEEIDLQRGSLAAPWVRRGTGASSIQIIARPGTTVAASRLEQ